MSDKIFHLASSALSLDLRHEFDAAVSDQTLDFEVRADHTLKIRCLDSGAGLAFREHDMRGLEQLVPRP